MSTYHFLLSDRDRDAVRAVRAFLHGRLAEQSTIDWALRTKPYEIVKRMAVLESLEFLNPHELGEPWYSAWRLIEQSWEEETLNNASSDAHHLQRRIDAGERSGSLIASITALVKPRLKIGIRSQPSHGPAAKRPRRVEDVFFASLGSHELMRPEIFRLDRIEDVDFLVALGTVLEGGVSSGLSLGRRLGWKGDHKFWQLGDLYYVAYLTQGDEAHNWDIDEFHHGISPSVKLLNAVVKRIAALDVPQAKAFVSRWSQISTPVHLRLWASLSQNSDLAAPAELTEFLLSLEDRPFWDVHTFPEVAEVRSLRFNDVSDSAQCKIVARIKRGPPATYWPRGSDRGRVNGARQYWAVRELRRIEVAGSQLDPSASLWLAERIGGHPELAQMDSVQFDFLSSPLSRGEAPAPEDRYDQLSGQERLSALEAALGSVRSSWDDDPAERAGAWISTAENADSILADLETALEGGRDYPNVWDRFGWSHSAPSRETEQSPGYLQTAQRVLNLLRLVPTSTLVQAIQGITHWMSAWQRVITKAPQLPAVWTTLWPVAVAATNGSEDVLDTVTLDESITAAQDLDVEKLDTLNTSAGRLVGVFLALCPSIVGNQNPFATSSSLRAMREAIASAEGRSGLIGRHRLIESLPYFLEADRGWSRETLIGPLLANDAGSLALWRAVSQRNQFTSVLKEIGDYFAERALDRRLGRQSRGSLLSSLVLESLHAYREVREPVVPNAKVQQTIRSVDDEVRATAAQIVQRFLISMSKTPSVQPGQSAEDVFQGSIAPFLANVWPQERSLATRGVAAAFADLPASAGDAFSEAVDAISRFIVPFDCWSMHSFGFHTGPEGMPGLESIDAPAKAAALLHLLDMSIGATEGSVAPMDLPEALEQIRRASANLAQQPAFRRLAARSRYR